MQWSVLTPDESAHWDQRELVFGPGVPASEAPRTDELEELWRTYYASIFNPARIKLNAMKREMPVRHWKTLPETQLKFAEAIIATGKPVVLVLVEGRPRVISRIADKVPGILLALNPSDEGGTAITDVLFGDYNPNGKLPFTYPRNPNNLLTYDFKLYDNDENAAVNAVTRPQFLFGT